MNLWNVWIQLHTLKKGSDGTIRRKKHYTNIVKKEMWFDENQRWKYNQRWINGLQWIFTYANSQQWPFVAVILFFNPIWFSLDISSFLRTNWSLLIGFVFFDFCFITLFLWWFHCCCCISIVKTFNISDFFSLRDHKQITCFMNVFSFQLKRCCETCFFDSLENVHFKSKWSRSQIHIINEHKTTNKNTNHKQWINEHKWRTE